MKIGVIGTGYVGLVTGACLAKIGHNVICLDKDEQKISALNNGTIPIYEPNLDKIIKETATKSRLSFSTDTTQGVRASQLIFICTGTPNDDNGQADLSSVKQAAREIAKAINSYKIVVIKSTVPVGTAKLVDEIVKNHLVSDQPFDVVSNPEFLREGTAVDDFMNPDRIIAGTNSKRAAQVMREIYQQIDASLLVTNPESSELIKYASNAFLATKISFINAISRLCDETDADVEDVAKGMGLDKRIGSCFLKSGPGWGGSCFPKDTRALVKIAEAHGFDFTLVKEVIRINNQQRQHIISKVQKHLKDFQGKRIGVLGLAFKPETDDIRESPAIKIIERLQAKGADITAYDPAAQENAKQVLNGIDYALDPYKAADGSDALLLLTEWDEFTNLNFNKLKSHLKNPIIIDARNCLDKHHLEDLGFVYEGVGK